MVNTSLTSGAHSRTVIIGNDGKFLDAAKYQRTNPAASSSAGDGDLSLQQVGSEVYVLDDGTSESSVGLSNGGDVMWLNAFTAQSGFETISSVRLTWGKPGGTAVPAGTPTSVLLYEDPNDDGNPNDAILLASTSTVVSNPNTDLFATVPITPSTVSGTFFVAALYPNQVAGMFPAPLDETTSAGQSWVAGHDTPGSFDIANLANNDLPPARLDSIGLTGNWLLRADAGDSGSQILLPDVDLFTLDLIAGSLVDVILSGQNGMDFSAESLEILGTDGTTVLASATDDPLGVDATNYDLGILDFLIPSDGIYTLRVNSRATGDYSVVVTSGDPGLTFDTEPNDGIELSTSPLRSLDTTNVALGWVGLNVRGENVLTDGGFELGPFGGAWNEFSSRFGTPICDLVCGTGNGTGP